MTEAPGAVPIESIELEQAIETFRVYSGVVLLAFAHHGSGLRDTIARNFVARGMRCTQSIFNVWKAGSDQDAWILHRALVDRLLHLHYLGATDTFSEFDDFSFLSLYKARTRLIAHQRMRDRIPQATSELHEQQKARYLDLFSSKTQPRWHRPKAQKVANEMDLGFLYDLGYDYASMHVHPMSDDGALDFDALTQSNRQHALPDPTVVRNSVLIQTLLVQEALNVSALRWRGIVYDFLTQVRDFLASSNPLYRHTMYRIGKNWPSIQLCEPMTATDHAR
jgi:hypothetical protein